MRTRGEAAAFVHGKAKLVSMVAVGNPVSSRRNAMNEKRGALLYLWRLLLFFFFVFRRCFSRQCPELIIE